MIEEAQWVNGEKHGYCRVVHANGDYGYGLYERGKAINTWRYYDTDGNDKMKIVFDAHGNFIM